MFTSRAVSLFLVLAAAGCSLYRSDTLRLDPAVRPPTAPDSMRLLGQEPAQAYRVVALVSVSNDWALGADYERLIWRMAQQAAKLGGQALLVGAESLTHGNDQTTLTGKVLVFDGAAPADAPFVRPRSSTAQAAVVVGVLVATSVLGLVGSH